MWELTLYFTADENGSASAESNMSLPHNVNQSIAIWLYSSILSTYQKRIVKTSISTSTQEKGTAELVTLTSGGSSPSLILSYINKLYKYCVK